MRRHRAALTFAPVALAIAVIVPATAQAAHHHQGPAKLSISNASVTEPNGSATVKAKFAVGLSRNSRQAVKVSYTTKLETASANDLNAKSGTLKIRPGHRHASIGIVVLGDNRHEPNETFKVKLSHAKHAHIKHAGATGTIVDNDSAGGGGGGGGGAPDADNDGIPDALDACPKDYDPDGYCPASVYDIDDGTVTHGAKVRVSGLTIAAVDRPDKAAWAEAQPGYPGFNAKGPQNSALKLAFSGAVPSSLAIGDEVTFAGTTATGEFDLASLDTTNTGATPTAANLSPADIGDPKYDGVLASVPGETLTTVAASSWTLFDGLTVPDTIISTLPARSPGQYFATLTGISSGTPSAPALMPRLNADIVNGTAPTRTVVSLHETDDCVNDNENNAPVARVRLSGPASSDTVVSMSSDNPSAVSVADATVMAGTDKAVVLASGVAPAAGITLSATLGADTVAADGPLTVRDHTANPCTGGTN